MTVELTVVAGETMVENTAAGCTCDATHDRVVSLGELVGGEAERITFKVSFAEARAAPAFFPGAAEAIYS